VWSVCDADGDGRMTHDEFESLLRSVGSQLSVVQRRSEFSRIDADADGLIDLSEFRLWWLGT
jgi:Ca2+-binding EF-hand superfamily protein